MIVSLDELKTVLGIDLLDTSQDAYLTRLIKAKSAWVENYTLRRFDTPIPHSQVQQGTGEGEIYLEWHIDDEATDPPTNPLPADTIVVSRRPMTEKFRDWEVLIEDEDWQRIGDVIYFLRWWGVWPECDQFKIDYLGGYQSAPEDIKEVVLEMCVDQYNTDTTVASGTSGITSEKIGDYSYNVDLGNVTSVAIDTSTSPNSMATLNRYKRRFQ